MDQSYSKGQQVAIGVIFLILPTAFVGLRVWARIVSRAGLSWDDYLIFLALVCGIGSCAAQLTAALHGLLGQHQPQWPDGTPILDHPGFLIYEKSKFALQMMNYLGLGFAKASILALCMRLFSIRKFRIASQVLLAVVAAWTISFFFGSLFQCYPITPLVEFFYNKNCVNTLQFYYAGAYSDVILDFIILLFPIPMVLTLQLPWRQKLAVMCIFLLGALAVAASVVRLVVFNQVGNKLRLYYYDLTYHTAPVFFWTVIELSLAIMSACLPTLRPLLVRYLPKMLSIWTHPSNASRFGSHFRKHQYVRSESDHADLAMPPTAHVQDLKYGIVRESSFRVDSRPRDMV